MCIFQSSKFSSRAVSKIITEAEAKKTLSASAVPWQFFADVIEQISVFALAIPRQSSEVASATLFYLINQYKTVINCSVKPVINSKQFKNIC